MNRFSQQKNKGFSIVEALVAISVLLVSIAGPMTIAQKGLTTANIARDQITAFYLGQEAIEYIRYMRDTNRTNGQLWTNGFTQCIDAVCTVDTTKEELDICIGGIGTCDNVRNDSSTGLYGHDALWDETRFNREFTISQTGPAEIAIDVVVTWNMGNLTRDITLHEVLFNWQ